MLCFHVYKNNVKSAFQPGKDVSHNAIEWPSAGWCCRWPQPGRDPSSAFQKLDKTESRLLCCHQRIAEDVTQAEGNPEQGWLWVQTQFAQDRVQGGSEIFQERREGGQLLWTSCVAAYMWEGFSWYRAGMSLLTIYGLSCCHAPLQSLMVLFGDPSWYCQAAVGSPPRSPLLRLNQPCSSSLSSHHKCSIQVPASWGPMLNSSQFINICFMLWGTKAEQTT